MKDITKAAKTYVELSHCDRCKFYLHCNLDRMEACRDTSIRAFIAGVLNMLGGRQNGESNAIANAFCGCFH